MIFIALSLTLARAIKILRGCNQQQVHSAEESWARQDEEHISGFGEGFEALNAGYINADGQEDYEVVMYIRATDDL